MPLEEFVDLRGHAALQLAAAEMSDKDIVILARTAAEGHVDVDVRLRLGPDDTLAKRRIRRVA